jgi:hypothetical protein
MLMCELQTLLTLQKDILDWTIGEYLHDMYSLDGNHLISTISVSRYLYLWTRHL